MKYLITNPELDLKITEIRTKIRLSMNGIVSESMARNGIHYKTNYGVSIPRLRELAGEYTQNPDLAKRLWLLPVRETMILATMLLPPAQCTAQLATQWASQCQNIELVEQICMNLFAKCENATTWITDWLATGDKWMQLCALTLATRIYAQCNQDLALEITRYCTQNKLAAPVVYRRAASCLARLCRISPDTAAYILKATQTFSASIHEPEYALYEEVKQEIIFLDIL